MVAGFYNFQFGTSGVGRIRTSGLQRPRLASYQARQRPPILKPFSQSTIHQYNFKFRQTVKKLFVLSYAGFI